MACRSWTGAWGPPVPVFASKCGVLRSCSIVYPLMHAEPRPREGRGPAQSYRSTSETGAGQSALSDFCSTTGQGCDSQGGGESWGSQHHIESLGASELFHASLLFPQTCLFLLRISQLLHPSVSLQDQLGSPSTASMGRHKAGQGACGSEERTKAAGTPISSGRLRWKV